MNVFSSKYPTMAKCGVSAICILVVLVIGSCSHPPEIVVQDLQMDLPEGVKTFSEELMIGEIADTKIEHVAYVGPTEQTIELVSGYVNMFLFVKGEGLLKTDTTYQLVPESIAIPMDSMNSIEIQVAEGEELHFLQFTKLLTAADMEDLKSFPAENRYALFFTRFEDCEPYTEKIKSPNTVSRTVLPADIVPRVSLGTVEAPGPDEVGAHEHPMLDQLFLGLTDNDILVHADGATAELKAYSLLHIPIGSSHGVTVAENKKMYYMWMDFFISREGQEWLKTHKPMSADEE